MNPNDPASPDAAGRDPEAASATAGNDRIRMIRDAQRAQERDAADIGDPRDPGLASDPVDQFDGPSFVDDVRSDGDEDERHDKR